MEKTCKQFKSESYSRNLSNVPKERFTFQYIEKYILLYCEILKAGSTTWMKGTFPEIAREMGLKLKTRKDLASYFKVKSMDELKKILGKDPVSFAIVRHPFERLVSAYLEKSVSWMRGKSFEYTLKRVLAEAQTSPDEMYTGMNNHYRPYDAVCLFCDIDYKIISKTETFAEDRSRILEMAGRPEVDPVRKNVHGGDQIEDWTKTHFKNIPTEVKTALLDLYKYEFVLFSYDKEMYL